MGLNFSIFHIVKNDVLTSDPLHDGYYIQTGQIVSNGIDFDVTGEITPAFLVNANYEYADAKVTKDSDPGIVGIKNLGSPDHCGNLWIKYNLPGAKLKGISISFGYQYMGKRSAVLVESNADKTKYLPVYNLLEAACSYSTEKFHIV
jgi:iron complex outermembrane receptor protein